MVVQFYLVIAPKDVVAVRHYFPAFAALVDHYAANGIVDDAYDSLKFADLADKTQPKCAMCGRVHGGRL